MSWKIRHAGSPRHVDITLPQIVEGLQDGQWAGNDEVVGPGDKHWRLLETHPALEDVIADIEEAENEAHKEPIDEEEQRLDMNPLIDVCLVLLIFFILATTLQIIEKVLDMPGNRTEGPGRIREVKEEDVKEFMLEVQAVREGGRQVVKVERKEVPQDDLERSIRRYVRETRKTELLIDAKDVEWGLVVKIIDAAAGAKIKKVHFKSTLPGAAAPAPGA